MKKLGRIAPVLALALLLSACGGSEPQQTPEPTPTPSGVAVHWDVLTPRPENIAVSRECTVELHDKYWSHRYTSKHGLQRGSQCAVIEI